MTDGMGILVLKEKFNSNAAYVSNFIFRKKILRLKHIIPYIWRKIKHLEFDFQYIYLFILIKKYAYTG